jgi:plasmid stabilization system protein ParE
MDQTTSPAKGAKHIEELLQQIPPDSERYQVLQSVRRFKSSWAELGKWLTRVATSGQFQEWGYNSFEEYCTREIRIRRQTADKLLLAYRFLEREEPGVLARREQHPIPDYRSVDLLRQAREEQPLAPEEYNTLRQAVFEEERSHPVLLRQFRDLTEPKQPPAERDQKQLRAALAAARRLQTALAPLGEVPEVYRETLGSLIQTLEEHAEP